MKIEVEQDGIDYMVSVSHNHSHWTTLFMNSLEDIKELAKVLNEFIENYDD